MPRTLYARLSLALGALLVLVGILFAILTVGATQSYLQEVSQRFNRELAHDLVSDRNLVQEGKLDQAALKETFSHYMTINPSIEIYLLDRAGAILAYSAEPDKVKRNSVSLEPIKRFLSDIGDAPLLGDDPRSHDGRKIFSVTPVPTEAAPEGYLYVILRGEEFDSVDALLQRSYFLRLTGWAVTVSLATGLALGLILFRLLTRRIDHLARAMDALRRSNFTALVQYPSDSNRRRDDEIDRLTSTFEAMAQRIIDQIQALTDKDTLRRELVAQVSHDLRTPLASLHGYLETLQMKGGGLGENERAEYLDIALRHSERLRGLIDDLFELAKLDAKDTRPELEPVSLGELAQDVIQKLRLTAERKGVRLELKGIGDAPYVQADIGLIERVLENLIDNALRHTPASGSIEVSTRLQGQTVAVQVTDSGCGISSEDQSHVFDRFFQVKAKHQGNHHGGLGLAIAKKIMELHNGRIAVRSDPGSGTTFTFSLPIWRQGR